jgi:hypothetical protein
MSVQSAEYESEMLEIVEKLEKWKDWSPELAKAIEIIKKTMWWATRIEVEKELEDRKKEFERS